jgi:hypothetical protein
MMRISFNFGSVRHSLTYIYDGHDIEWRESRSRLPGGDLMRQSSSHVEIQH